MAKKIGTLRRHSASQRWIVWYDGKTHYIAGPEVTEEDAQKAYDAFVQKVTIEQNGIAENEEKVTIRSLVTFYLTEGNTKGCTSNKYHRREYCEAFVCEFGNLTIKDVKPYMVERWLTNHPSWQRTTLANVCKHLAACFNWLVKNDKIARSPLKGVDRPQTFARGEEFVITNDEYLRLLGTLSDTYRPIVELLWNSGCRPDEALSATKEEYKEDLHLLRKKTHKTSGKGKVRDIVLNKRAEEIIAAAAAKVESGLLFLSAAGRKISPGVLRQYLDRRFEEVGITHPVCPYSFRHSAAVRWIEVPLPIHVVAAWLGNTVAVCERHYTKTMERVRNTRHLMPD